jgi:hypothetical protein
MLPSHHAAPRVPLLGLHPLQPLPHPLHRTNQQPAIPSRTTPPANSRNPHRPLANRPPCLLRVLPIHPQRHHPREGTKALDPRPKDRLDRVRQSNVGRTPHRLNSAVILPLPFLFVIPEGNLRSHLSLPFCWHSRSESAFAFVVACSPSAAPSVKNAASAVPYRRKMLPGFSPEVCFSRCRTS